MTRDEVIETLRNYKRVLTIYEMLLNEYENPLKAQVLSDMPRCNGLSNPTEKAIFLHGNDLKELEIEIKRVQIWLNYLTEEERFIIEQIYIEERYYAIASNKWCSMGREYHSESYWKRKKKDAIRKICNILKEIDLYLTRN